MVTAPMPTTAPPAAVPGTEALSDGKLLARFVSHQDEAAFEALVRRHGPMVFRLCRRVLRDGIEAEDAFQATFIVLARKAASVLKSDSVGSWLYGVAYRVAARARARAGRRHSVEHAYCAAVPAGSSRNDTDPELLWRDLRPTLDEEVSRLPEKYRLPVVLCYFEGKTNEQAAAQLVCPVGTVKVRLMRARDLLRTRMTQRGLALSAATFGTLLAGEGAVMALPALMVDATVRGAARGPLAASAAALVNATLQGMTLAKLNQWGGIGALVGLLLMLIPWGAGAWQRATTLPPHKAKVTCVALSVDGNLVASIATNDDQVKLRDLVTGREWSIPTTIAAAEFHLMSLSPDGAHMAIESFDYPWGKPNPVKTTLKVLDARSGRERFTLAEPEYVRHLLRFTKDGRQVRFAAQDQATKRVQVQTRDVATGKIDRVYRGPDVPASSVSLSQEGLVLVVGSPEWARTPGRVGIRLWNAAREREIGVVSDDSPGLGFSQLSPDNRLLIITEANTHVGHDDYGVVFQLLDTKGKQPRRVITFGPAGSYVTRVTFSPDGEILALNGNINNRATAKFYDTATGKERQVIQGSSAQKNGFSALAISADGSTLALGEQNGSVSLWKWKR